MKTLMKILSLSNRNCREKNEEMMCKSPPQTSVMNKKKITVIGFRTACHQRSCCLMSILCMVLGIIPDTSYTLFSFAGIKVRLL
jgi:hypothetical protein